jgi:hypothetical protein
MPRSKMTGEELVAIFAMKPIAPPLEANKLLVRHLNAKNRYVSPAPSGRRWTGSQVQTACRSPLLPNSFRPSDNNPRALHSVRLFPPSTRFQRNTTTKSMRNCFTI